VADRNDLEHYHAKRDFRRTAEPKGKAGQRAKQRTSARRRAGGRYVIQKHAARRLHFDFRLELDGVLKSWAVTRGPSLDPADKRLAVRTEDHPLDYRHFEGVIPKGEYGGGTVMLWDTGRWIPKDDPHEGLQRGSLKFQLEGERLRGGFTLVRLRGRDKRDAERENWLLIKERDGTADRQRDPVAEWTTSVTTGRDLDGITADENATVTLTRPRFVPPQLATPEKAAPDGDDWLHEIKFDGYRVLAAVAGDDFRIYTRSGQDWTHRFHALGHGLAKLRCKAALIDGEVVVFDERGRSDFSALQRAIKHGDADFVMMAFDLLELDGRDLKPLPLQERKRALAKLLPKRNSNVIYSDHEIGHGPEVWRHACELKLEGIISKRIDAAYRSTRTTSWLKIKCTGRDEFVVGGYRPSSARGRHFASLLIGEYVGDTLYYRGRVGTGFNDRVLAELGARLQRIARKRCPFTDMPPGAAHDAHWVKPELVVEVAYTERTRDGILRHPSYLGLREDKRARDVQAQPSGNGRRVSHGQ
jgi:DNA ligase D-like protein (predicted ligase)/DNA ligase D-like protein (predicted 3'-phosphoesterase)